MIKKMALVAFFLREIKNFKKRRQSSQISLLKHIKNKVKVLIRPFLIDRRYNF